MRPSPVLIFVLCGSAALGKHHIPLSAASSCLPNDYPRRQMVFLWWLLLNAIRYLKTANVFSSCLICVVRKWKIAFPSNSWPPSPASHSSADAGNKDTALGCLPFHFGSSHKGFSWKDIFSSCVKAGLLHCCKPFTFVWRDWDLQIFGVYLIFKLAICAKPTLFCPC